MKLPESIEYYIFAICSSIYYGENKLSIPQEVIKLYEGNLEEEKMSNKKKIEVEQQSLKDKNDLLNGYWI